MTKARRLTHDGIEERRRNLKAFRKELEMEGDETFNTTLQMQEQWLATVDALVAREGELVAALRSLESVTRSYLQYPLKGEEPGYDAKDVLAYCNEALAALGESP